ncbi:MAG: DUF1566 domain-containing protein [Deltaproteobacteria bacterium]|nr:DUF1566 domain-containing protein [Deltaproteobacteria bacterium]
MTDDNRRVHHGDLRGDDAGRPRWSALRAALAIGLLALLAPACDDSSNPIDDAADEADGPPDAEDGTDADAEAETAPRCGDGALDDGEECDDGNDVSGDGCEPSTCVFSCHADADCRESPDDPCTTDTCDEVDGGRMCGRAPNPGAACDDGDACTEDDRCDADGLCRPGTSICDCPGGTTAECAAFEDGDLCNGTLVCNAGTRTCEVDPATVVTCPPAEACRTFACVPATGECPPTNRDAGTSCDDGLFCTGPDACDDSGTCASAGDPCPESCRTCNEDTDACDVSADWCWIDGACHATDAVDPSDPCRRCRPAVAVTEWAAGPDFTPCSVVTTPTDYSYDICVRGACVSPGSCGDASCNAPGPNWTIPDTNQRSCYDATGTPLASCPGTAGSATCSTTAFCGQDAQYGWDTTHPASARFMRTDTTEPIVRDNVTGLVWQGCAAGQVDTACVGTATSHTWAEALAFCDGLAWDGPSDWRLPDAFELQTLLDYGRSAAPYIDPTAFPAAPNDRFWSSSAYAGAPSFAWVVLFDMGLVAYGGTSDTALIRCVRCAAPVPAPPAPRLTRTEPVAGQPVVEDTGTGYFWQGCPAGLSGAACTDGSVSTMSWQAALAYCEGLDWGGRSDWRLPNVTELRPIVDDTHESPAIDTTVFPATPADRFWSSSSVARSSSDAWFVHFGSGSAVNGDKTDDSGVRCACVGP